MENKLKAQGKYPEQRIKKYLTLYLNIKHQYITRKTMSDFEGCEIRNTILVQTL